MSEFEVKVVRITQPVEHHPDADRLSIVKIGGYNCISGKNEDGSHRYSEGELVVYVPEAAVVPEWALKHYGFWDETKDRGMLSGPNYDRVRAVKLRGVVSQGLLFKLNAYVDDTGITTWYMPMLHSSGYMIQFPVYENDEVASILGITKYEPPIPTGLAGSVTRIPHPGTVKVNGDVIFKYDFENIQKVTDMFEEGEEVYLTEKLHGTFCQIGYIPGLNHTEGFGDWFVASKGLGRQGLCFQDLPENTSNLYVKTLKKLLVNDRFVKAVKDVSNFGEHPVWVFGEIFGENVQDLDYGLKEPEFRIFDIRTVLGGRNYFLSMGTVALFCKMAEIAQVPVLAVGNYSQEFIEEFRDGKTTLDGNHMREGVVIRSTYEYPHPKYERKIAKAVSPDYLLRKNGTEYN